MNRVLEELLNNYIEHELSKNKEKVELRSMLNRCVILPQIERKAKLNKKLKEAKGSKC